MIMSSNHCTGTNLSTRITGLLYYCVMLAGSIVNLIFWGIALIFGHFYHDAPPPQDQVQQEAGKMCGN